MKNIAFVTGADHGLGYGITLRLAQLGWQVYAGQYKPEFKDLYELADKYPDNVTIVPVDVTSDNSVKEAASIVTASAGHVDMLVNNAGVNSPVASRPSIQEIQDYDEMMRLYDTNALGPLRIAEGFLPLMDKGSMKRLCFVSSEAGSINACERKSWYGYCMSKAALNMATAILFNRLRREGFTFRLYHPGWVQSYIGGKKNPDADLSPEAAGVYAVEYFTRNYSIEPDNPKHSGEDRLVLRDYTGREWPW